jgi:hypothetical protein
MQEPKLQLKTETWKDRLAFHWMGLRGPVYFLITIVIPPAIDTLLGHICGSVAAAATVVIWLYFGLKSRMAPGTRMIWLVAFVCVVIVAIVEFAHLFHWKL